MRNRKSRIFISVFLPKEWEEKLEKYQNAFPRINGLRWVDPRNLHLTLLFLGLTREDKFPKIKAALTKVSQKTDPFTMEFDRFNFAPPNKISTMIWGQFNQSPEFGFLANDIKKEITKITILDEDHKTGLPHITMARFKGAKVPTHIDAKMKDTSLEIDRFQLVLSQLGARGPKYQILGEYELKDIRE